MSRRCRTRLRHLFARTLAPALLAALGVLCAGCRGPDLDGHRFTCQTNSDCGDGFVCHTAQRECFRAFDDQHGVFFNRIVFGMSTVTDNSELGTVGKIARAGFMAYFAEVNASGGVHGRKLELVVKDDKADPALTTKNVKSMIDGRNRQVFALVGVLGTEPALAAREVAVKNKVLFFAPGTGFDGLEPDPPDRYVFNVRLRYSEEASQLATYLTKTSNVPAKNIAVFAQGKNNRGTLDPFGKSGFDGVAATLGKSGVDPSEIAYTTFTALTPRDKLAAELAPAVAGTVAWIASSARQKKPGSNGEVAVGVVIAALADSASGFIAGVEGCLSLARAVVAKLKPESTFKQSCGTVDSAGLTQLAKATLSFAALSPVGLGLSTALTSIGKYTAVTPTGGSTQRFHGVGTIVASPVPHPASNATGVIAYREQLARYDSKQVPSPISLEGYVSAWLFVEALRKQGRDITTESLISTLETVKVDLGIGTTLEFSPNSHQASKKLWGVKVDDSLQLQPLGVLVE